MNQQVKQRYNQEYYILSGSSDEAYPLFELNEELLELNPVMDRKAIAIDASRPADNDLILPFSLQIYDEPYRLTDYHVSPKAIVSSRLKDLIEALNIFKTQMVRSRIQIEGKKDLLDAYYLWHIHNAIPCLDRSTAIMEDHGDDIFDIDAFSISDEALDKITLDKRLIFNPEESLSMYFVHKSLVKQLQSFGMEGAVFTKVADALEDAVNA